MAFGDARAGATTPHLATVSIPARPVRRLATERARGRLPVVPAVSISAGRTLRSRDESPPAE